MQVTQEKRPGSRIGLTIAVEATQVKKSYDKTVQDLIRNVQIQGFRKGKAPRNVVIRYIGKERVQANAIDDLINESVRQALKEANLNTLGSFQLDGGVETLFLNFNPEGEFTFSGYVEVYPEVQLGEYQNLALTVTRVDPDATQVEETIDRWREQRATLLPVEDRSAQLGDVAFVDFTGFDPEGNEIEGASGKDFQLDLKETNFIPGFVAGIVGMKPEETREIEAQFPDDYFEEALAGTTAKFSVTLHDLKAKELPELTDQFVQEISRFETVADLRQHLEDRLIQDALSQSQNNLEEAILNAILAVTAVDLPETLVEQETLQLLAQNLAQLSERGLPIKDIRQFISQLPPETMQSLRERFQPDAETRLRRTLALGEIVQQQQISVGRTELEVRVRDVVDSYSGQEKLDPKRLQQVIHEDLLTSKVMAWLKSQTTVSWVDADGNPVEAPQLEPEADWEAPESIVESSIPEAEFSDESVAEDPSTTVIEVEASATDSSAQEQEAESVAAEP
jgi:trigger factor